MKIRSWIIKEKFILVVLALAMGLRLILAYYNYNFSPTFSIQQDNYADFAAAWRKGTLTTGELSYFDTRLFPGYPALILVVSELLFLSPISAGVTISFISSMVAIFCFWRWTRQRLATVIFAFFPPVWLHLSTKVATEPLTISLLLITLLLTRHQKYFLAGLVLGYCCLVRNIAVFLALALIWEILTGDSSITTKKRFLFLFSIGGVLSVLSLLGFNYLVWGPTHWAYQFMVYNQELDTALGIVMLFQNIYRTLDWGQYRILISGLFYVGLNAVGMWGLFKNRADKSVFGISFYWAALSLAFLLLLSMQTFLEDFSRYAVVFWPAIALGVSKLSWWKAVESLVVKPKPSVTTKRRKSRNQQMFSWRPQILVAIFSLLSSLLMAEAFLRMKRRSTAVSINEIPISRTQTQITSDMEKMKYIYRPYILWRGKPTLDSETFSLNSLGLRGNEYHLEKPANTYRIILLGGSAAWGLGASSNQTTISSLLEEKLQASGKEIQYEVFNFSEIGYSSSQELILWNEISLYQPDLVIHYTGYNDLYTGFLALEPGANHPYIKSDLLIESSLVAVQKLISIELLTFLQKSYLFQSIYYRFPDQNSTSHYSDLNEVARIFGKNMKFSTELAKSQKTELMVVLQPSLFWDNKPRTKSEEKFLLQFNTAFPDASAYFIHGHQLLVAELTKSDISFIDGSSFFATQPQPLYIDQVHYVDQGNEVVASFLAAAILK